MNIMPKRLSEAEFIEKSNKIHNFGFDYSAVRFVNTITPVEIKCNKHNVVFLQAPKTHLRGNTSCPQCTNEKKKQTTIKNYGVENPSQSDVIKQKKSNTCLKNHGGTYTLTSKKLIAKVKATCMTRYGYDNPNKNSNVRDKIKQTNLERYNVDCPFKSSDIKNKIKQTNLDRYGHEYPMQNDEVQDRTKQTNLDRYGHEYATQNIEIRNKTITTNMERYGNPAPAQNVIIKKKILNTNIKRYGVEYHSQHNIPNNVLDRLNDITFLTTEHRIHRKSLTQIAHELGVTSKTIWNYFNKLNIPIIRHPRSQMEIDIVQVISSHYNGNIITNTRTLISQEIDIFLPELNIAFEINGNYFHSELKGKGKEYHLNKFIKCAELGITLVHLWEHDWNLSRDIVISLILMKIGKTANKINARKCVVNTIDSKTARLFLNKNHLDGYANASTHIGLYHNDELVSVMTFALSRFSKNEQYEMVRFATILNTTVRGGAGKLLKFFINICSPTSIVTYAKQELFSGGVYEQIGFTLKHISPPNFKYFHKSNTIKLYSRMKFQKYKLKKLLSLYDPLLSAWENMKDNGYDRIWDCGNKVYVITFDSPLTKSTS